MWRFWSCDASNLRGCPMVGASGHTYGGRRRTPLHVVFTGLLLTWLFSTWLFSTWLSLACAFVWLFAVAVDVPVPVMLLVRV